MKRTFVELPAFGRLVRSGLISDQMLKDIQNDIMRFEGERIPGTAGLMKLRTTGSGRGKSGGVRTVYADYPAPGVTVLITAYFKNMKTDLTAEETNLLAAMKRRLDKEIGGRYGRKKT